MKIGTGIGCGIVVDGELYRGVDGCAGDIGHIRVDGLRPDLRVRQHRLPRGVLRRRRPRPRRDRRGPVRPLAVLAAMLAEQRRAHRRRRRPRGRRRATPSAVQLIRDSGRRVGQVLASLVSFFNPGLIVIGGGVTGLGHALLAEIRGVDLPPVAAAGHRQPADRAQRARQPRAASSAPPG